jgi:hypothetical protein
MVSGRLISCMKRFALISVTVIVTLPSTAAVAGSTTSAPPITPAVAAPARSQLAGFACHQALEPVARSMSVRAVMRPITGTQRMEMRFELLSRSSTATGLVTLHGGGLGSWILPPNPTLGQRPGDVWIVPHPVYNLIAPAAYHYLVSFRWIGTGGTVLSSRTRRSGNCLQPELRPDLLVSSITVQPILDKPANEQYVAAIENIGSTAAGPFDVSLTPGAAAPGATPVAVTKPLERLAAGATRNVTFVGPACTALSAPTIVADPNRMVDEADYDDNSLAVAATCPPLTTAPVPAP